MKTEKKVRYILHVDVNSAFLSWSAVQRLKEQPGSVDLRTIPSAVAGDVTTRHGIITAKSIPAKKLGIRTAEPVGSAKAKCPDLVLVRSDFTVYRAYSRAFIGILKTYTDKVEQVSIDEAYMDVTERVAADTAGDGGQAAGGPTAEAGGHVAAAGGQTADKAGQAADAGEKAMRASAVHLAGRIRDEIRDSLSFTVNVGVSVNRLLAKTASDFEKPDRVHTLWPEEVSFKLWPLPIGELHGCGHATAEKLTGIGIRTIGDAAHTEKSVLQSLLGEKAGNYIKDSANGRGSDAVNPEQEDARGYSNEVTTPFDLTASNYEKDGLPIAKKLARKVAERLQKDGVYAATIGVAVKTDEFRRLSRQTTLPDSTNDPDIIAGTAGKLLAALLLDPEKGLLTLGGAVRLLGISASKLDKGEYRQISLFDYAARKKEEERKKEEDAKEERKKERLREMMGSIRKRYGEGALSRGISGKKDTTDEF